MRIEMKFTYEKKENQFVISDQYQTFVVNGEDVAEFGRLVDSIKINFFLGGDHVQETTYRVDTRDTESGEKLPRTKVQKRKKKRRVVSSRVKQLQNRGAKKVSSSSNDGK